MIVAPSLKARWVCRSISATTSGGADPPKSGLYLMPLNSAELCDAVITMAPAALFRMVDQDTAGVGETPSSRITCFPLAARTLAASRAKSSAQYRESCPTTIARSSLPTYQATPWLTARTFS